MQPSAHIPRAALLAAGLILLATAGCNDAFAAPLDQVEGCSDEGGFDCIAACERGQAESCTRLGDMLSQGLAMPRSDARALRAYERACVVGDASGCAAAGGLILRTRSLPRDASTAASYLDRGCAGHEPEACVKLAALYETGQGVSPSIEQATRLLTGACDGGYVQGCTKLGELLMMTADKAPQADVRAATLYWQGCGGGDMRGCMLLGSAYLDGQGLVVDIERGESLLMRACLAGVESGCARLTQARAR